jgi:sec-independent protein translocase protein TatA
MWTPSPAELVFVLLILVVVLGPRRLPDAGRALGRGLREFKLSLTGDASHTPDHLSDK